MSDADLVFEEKKEFSLSQNEGFYQNEMSKKVSFPYNVGSEMR